MNELKFLGKPAPEMKLVIFEGERLKECAVCKMSLFADAQGTCFCRQEHLEGAIKEAANMIEEPFCNWPKEVRKEAATWAAENEFIFAANEEYYVAFLLRKTLGEQP